MAEVDPANVFEVEPFWTGENIGELTKVAPLTFDRDHCRRWRLYRAFDLALCLVVLLETPWMLLWKLLLVLLLL